MKNMYEIKNHMVIECDSDMRKEIEEELMDAIVAVADKHKCVLNGYLYLDELQDEDNELSNCQEDGRLFSTE